MKKKYNHKRNSINVKGERNMRKNGLLFICLCVTGLIFTACSGSPSGSGGGQNDSNGIESSIVGSWERQLDVDDTWIITFKADGTCEAYDDGVLFTTGTYAISVSEMSLIDGSCGDFQGKYNFSLNNNNLTFTLISDECEGRAEVLNGGWIKK